MVKKSELVQTFAEAIATMEGFYKHDSRAWRNNNPGNLRSWGNAPIVDGYAKFRTADLGWVSLRVQVTKNLFVRRLSILEFFAGKKNVYPGYAPAADQNQPAHYAEFVRQFILKRHPSLTALNAGVGALLCEVEFQPETNGD